MIKQIIEKHIIPAKDYVYGFANLKGLLPENYSEYEYGISIGKRLDDNIVSKLIDGPTIEYFHHYNDVNKKLAEITKEIHRDLAANNIHSYPVIPTISVGSEEYKRYLRTLSFDISHKMVATRAGLGWIGKTDLLVTKQFGPRLRLVTVLLKNDPGYHAKPIEKSRCGNCVICVDKCPAKAANGLDMECFRTQGHIFQCL